MWRALPFLDSLAPLFSTILIRDAPRPTAGAGHIRAQPAGRLADVARRSNNFCRHVRHPLSSHGPLERLLAHRYHGGGTGAPDRHHVRPGII